MRKHLAWVVGAALALAAAPAAADHNGIHPTFRQEQVYFKCVGPNKVQNFDAPAPWETTPPAGSVQDGEGCGVVDVGELEGLEFAATGDAVGNLTNLTIELYVMPFTVPFTNPVVADPEVWLNVDLVIDGQQILNPAIVTQVPWEETNSGVTQKVEFTVLGLGAWFATEDGDGEQVREVQLTVSHDFPVEVGSWVWDTTEVPAGITFNDQTPSQHTVFP
jgi:hypothetical protein